MWGKKEKHCDRSNPADDEYGDCWDIVILDAETKLVVSLMMGTRTTEMIETAFVAFVGRTDGKPPELITTDENPAYETVIRELFPSATGRANGQPPAGPCYAVVHKRRAKGRVVEVTKRLVRGSARQLRRAVAASRCSQTVNTSYVERYNATHRHLNARKARKVYTFSKEVEYHIGVTWLCVVAYNFCRPHLGLRRKLSSKPKRYQQRTPAMVAGLTKNIWKISDVLRHPIFPCRNSVGLEAA